MARQRPQGVDMDGASAVKADKPADAFGAGRALVCRGKQPAGAAPVAKGMPYPTAWRALQPFSPRPRGPGTSRAEALSAGWREFLLRTGLVEFTKPPMFAAPARARRGDGSAPRGRVQSPCHDPDGVGDDAVAELDAATSITCSR